MKQHETTDSVRIPKELTAKIREIAKSKRQTITGYIELNLSKTVERDWVKLKQKEGELQQSKD